MAKRLDAVSPSEISGTDVANHSQDLFRDLIRKMAIVAATRRSDLIERYPILVDTGRDSCRSALGGRQSTSERPGRVDSRRKSGPSAAGARKLGAERPQRVAFSAHSTDGPFKQSTVPPSVLDAYCESIATKLEVPVYTDRMAALADKALKRLYVAHWRGIRAYLAKRTRDWTVADDLTQETFVRFVEQGDDGDIKDGRSWLYRTAHNLAVDQARQIARRRTDATDVADLEVVQDDLPSAEATAIARQELDHLRMVIEELPELTKRIFVLTRIDGLTYSETARRLGISDSSVQKHLARAVRHVAERFRPN